MVIKQQALFIMVHVNISTQPETAPLLTVVTASTTRIEAPSSVEGRVHFGWTEDEVKGLIGKSVYDQFLDGRRSFLVD